MNPFTAGQADEDLPERNKNMKLKVINPGIDYMIRGILDFQTDGSTDFWTAPLYRFYPQLDREYAASLPTADRQQYISRILRQVYMDQKTVIDEKAVQYARHWERHSDQITAALSDAFETDCSIIFNDMVCNVSLNPICPRFLETHSFDIFYLNSERGALGLAIHEIIHFVWFHVWHRLFEDSCEEYESPSLKWILSEMAVEPVMRDSRLSSLNPYFPRENGGCVYPYFYTMMIEGQPVLDTLDDLYRRLPIDAFMKESYAYCTAHEKEIRQHIREEECRIGSSL